MSTARENGGFSEACVALPGALIGNLLGHASAVLA